MKVNTESFDILTDKGFERIMMEAKPELREKRISITRIKHMHSVAELMFDRYPLFQCKYLSRDEIYILGLNHDIGYIGGKTLHEFRGAGMFAEFCEFGLKHPITECIFNHGYTPAEYMKKYNCTKEEIPDELVLLWWADMCVESGGEHAGEIVGFQGRLDGIEKRYGKDSEPYRICKETINWLTNNLADRILGENIKAK